MAEFFECYLTALGIDLPYDTAETVGYSLHALASALPLIVGLTVSDNSMAPFLSKGEMVYAQQLPFVEGTVCLVQVSDDDYVIRTVRKEGEEYLLTALNPDFPDARVAVKDTDLPMRIIRRDFPDKHK